MAEFEWLQRRLSANQSATHSHFLRIKSRIATATLAKIQEFKRAFRRLSAMLARGSPPLSFVEGCPALPWCESRIHMPGIKHPLAFGEDVRCQAK
jgi:hypothetical protein